MAGKKGRSGKDHHSTSPKPGGSKDGRKQGRGAKPGPKPGSNSNK